MTLGHLTPPRGVPQPGQQLQNLPGLLLTPSHPHTLTGGLRPPPREVPHPTTRRSPPPRPRGPHHPRHLSPRHPQDRGDLIQHPENLHSRRTHRCSADTRISRRSRTRHTSRGDDLTHHHPQPRHTLHQPRHTRRTRRGTERRRRGQRQRRRRRRRRRHQRRRRHRRLRERLRNTRGTPDFGRLRRERGPRRTRQPRHERRRRHCGGPPTVRRHNHRHRHRHRRPRGRPRGRTARPTTSTNRLCRHPAHPLVSQPHANRTRVPRVNPNTDKRTPQRAPEDTATHHRPGDNRPPLAAGVRDAAPLSSLHDVPRM